MHRLRGTRWPAALGLVIVLLISAPAEAAVAPMALEQLVLRSDAIFVGDVKQVIEVPVTYLPDLDEPDDQESPARLAQLVVNRWIRGAYVAKLYWVWGSGTWSSDVTGPRKGEICLWFLERGEVATWLTPKSYAQMTKRIGGHHVYRVAASGRGQMRLQPYDKRSHASVRTRDIHLPRELATLPDEDPRFDSRRLVPLDALLAHVASQPGDSPLEQALGASARVGSWTEEWEHALRGVKREHTADLLKIIDTPGHALRVSATYALCAVLEGRAVDRLMRELGSKSVARRRGALFGVEMLRRLVAGLDGATPIRLALADPDPEVRWRALRVLTAYESDDSKGVAASLTDAHPLVRWHAARLLRSMAHLSVHVFGPGPQRVLEQRLLKLNGDKDLRVRRSAWEALTTLASWAAVPTIHAARKSTDRVVRQCAILAIGAIRTDEATRLLIQFLRDPDAVIRRAAASALGNAEALGCVDALIAGLQDVDALSRAGCAWALQSIGPDAYKALPALRFHATYDSDGDVRYAAWNSLMELTD